MKSGVSCFDRGFACIPFKVHEVTVHGLLWFADFAACLYGLYVCSVWFLCCLNPT